MSEGSRSLKKMGLKPCPFCGSKVRFVTDIDGVPNGIWCDQCHMVARFAAITPNPKDMFEKVMTEMADAWNSRGIR